MSTFNEIWPKLARSKKYREEFVASHAKQAIPFQIRALMKQLGLSQKELAARCGLTQGAISRAADPSYGNLTINTLVRIAAGFDVAFVGRFVPFSDLPSWFDRLYEGKGFYVETFEEEDAKRRAPVPVVAAVTAERQELGSIPEASQLAQDVPEPFTTPIEQPRGDDARWRQLLAAVPMDMLKSELPEPAQESAKGTVYA